MKWVSKCLSVHPYVRRSVHIIAYSVLMVPLRIYSLTPSIKSSLDFNEIWYVDRGPRVMHDGMQYDPIQGQCLEPLKVGNSAIFNGHLLPSPIYNGGWHMTTDS